MVSPPQVPPVSEVVSLAVTLHQSGHPVEAEELYKRALQREPDQVDALHFLGVLRHQQGDSAEAVRLIRLALRGNPSYLGARVNLGNVLKESERFPEAESEYRKVLHADPKNASAWNNLGAVLRVLKRTDDAITAFQSAIELQPRFADAYQNLGNALKASDRLSEALTAYRTAVEIEPRNTRAHLSLGRALYAFGRVDEALTVYQKWLEIDPDNAVAKHMVASCQCDEVPERCSDEFVKVSFDAFASSFDEVLQRLDYRAPELIEEAIQNALPMAEGKLNVLDAGCGTGLCGESLKPYARRLIGVDLSPKMLQKAKTRDIYDDLQEAELSAFMASRPSQFDLIVSADTLIYFGALDEALAAACNALRPGGVIAFTLEHAEPDSAPLGYRLNPHGRFSHTEDYVTGCLNRAGFKIRAINEDVLRREMKTPVNGLVITADKSA